jgi:uncharacterized LabA/DUF88 family protein
MRTVIYVDGFNLYYSVLRRTNLKWLDLVALFRDHVLDSNAQLLEVRYYTAPILARMSDDPQSVQRQRIYLQALRRMHPDQLKIIEGRIAVTTPFQRLVRPIAGASDISRVQVYDFNEKKTDVNLASDLLAGAWTGAFDQAVICSNDTDLEQALATLRKYHPQLRLGIVAPVRGSDNRYIAADLKQHADWSKALSMVHISNAQLPERIPASALRRPETWK